MKAKKQVAIGLTIVVIAVGAAFGWNRYRAHKQRLREEEILSFLVDELTKSDAESGLSYTNRPECTGEYAFLCEWSNERNQKFVQQHADEMNDFIWWHQADPRVPKIQNVLRSWGRYTKMTCEQMRKGETGYTGPDGGTFTIEYSKYDMYKEGCL